MKSLTSFLLLLLPVLGWGQSTAPENVVLGPGDTVKTFSHEVFLNGDEVPDRFEYSRGGISKVTFRFVDGASGKEIKLKKHKSELIPDYYATWLEVQTIDLVCDDQRKEVFVRFQQKEGQDGDPFFSSAVIFRLDEKGKKMEVLWEFLEWHEQGTPDEVEPINQVKVVSAADACPAALQLTFGGYDPHQYSIRYDGASERFVAVK